MIPIKYICDVKDHPILGPMVENLKTDDKASREQYDWLVDRAKALDQKRKDLADKFWDDVCEVLKAEGKLPKDFVVKGEIMITFGSAESTQLFTLKRPDDIRSFLGGFE